MDKVKLKVEGMTCGNCALSISKYLEKEGLKNVKVNPINGQVSFEVGENSFEENKISKGINNLGYKVVSNGHDGHGHSHAHDHDHESSEGINIQLKRFLICLPLTLVLMLH